MRTSVALWLVLLLVSFSSIAQKNVIRELEAKRTYGIVKIDGLLNDSAWRDAAIMTDMVEFKPKIGALEDPANRTIAWLMYSDEGIYFGGFCHERTKDSIATELTGTRDGFGANDYSICRICDKEINLLIPEATN